MSNNGRPLSPHLSIYRWPITMTTSILHRATGIAMSVGLAIYCGWLLAAASGTAEYAELAAILGTLPGRFVLVGLSFSFFFHLGNGIRHFFWDAGRGFEKSTANASAWFVLLFAVVLTAVFWWVRT